MARRIILHAGTEKTGTTSIQRFLWENRKELLDRGCLYPESLGRGPHIKLTGCCVEFATDSPVMRILNIESEKQHEKHIQKTLSSLEREIEKTDSGYVIFSDEHINVHLSRRYLLDKLRSICGRFGTVSDVVVYLRRQDRFLASMLSQAIKSGRFKSESVNHPIERPIDTSFRFDYLSILENLKDAFYESNLHVKGYRDQDGTFDAVRDFSELFSFLGGLDHKVDRHNKSVPAAAVSAITQIRETAESLTETGFLENWRSFVDCVVDAFPGPGIRLNGPDTTKFMSRFEKSNRELIAEYPDLSDVLVYDDVQRSTHEHLANVQPIEAETVCRVVMSSSLPKTVRSALNRIRCELIATPTA